MVNQQFKEPSPNAQAIIVPIVMVLMFWLLYLEPIEMAGIKVSHLWKAALLVPAMLWLLLVVQNNGWRLSFNSDLAKWFCVWWIMFAVVPLLSLPLERDPISSVFTFSQRCLPLVISLLFFQRKVAAQKGEGFLKLLTIFVVISAVPFLFGLLEPIGTAYDLSNIADSEIEGFVGIYQKAHSAGLMFMFSSLCAFSFAARSRRWSQVLWAIIFIVSVYLLFMTFVRSAIVGFVLGILYLSYALALWRRGWRAFAVLLLGVVIIASTLSDISGIERRFLGISKQTEISTVDINVTSSGRIHMWSTALQIYAESNPKNWILGVGRDRVPDLMNERTGRRVFAHNGFINELLGGGIVAFITILGFLIYMWKAPGKMLPSSLGPLMRGMVIGLAFFVFVQSPDYPLQLLFFSPLVSRNI